MPHKHLRPKSCSIEKERNINVYYYLGPGDVKVNSGACVARLLLESLSPVRDPISEAVADVGVSIE